MMRMSSAVLSRPRRPLKKPTLSTSIRQSEKLRKLLLVLLERLVAAKNSPSRNIWKVKSLRKRKKKKKKKKKKRKKRKRRKN